MIKTKQPLLETIQEGIHLHYLEGKKFKTNLISILIRTKLTREDVTKNALLVEVLKKGCTLYPSSYEIAKKTEELYGSVFDSYIIKKGEEQIFCFYLESLKKSPNQEFLLKQSIEFLDQIVRNPLADGDSFLENIVEREKETLRQRIRSQSDDKKEYAKIRCLEEMCKEEPFGIYADGYEEDLDSITGVTLFSQYQKLMETAPIEIMISGEIENEEELNPVFQIFSFERKKGQEEKAKEGFNKTDDVKEVEQSMDILQGKLCMGFRTGIHPTGKEFYSLLVFNEIFGGGANSRLFLNVREKESLCYYISSFLYRFKGIVFLQAGIEIEKKKDTIAIIMRCLEELQSNPVPIEELEYAKLSLKKSYENLKDSQAASLDFYLSQFLLQDQDSISDFIQEIQNVTAEQVQQVAEKVKLDTIYFLKGKEKSNEKEGK